MNTDGTIFLVTVPPSVILSNMFRQILCGVTWAIMNQLHQQTDLSAEQIFIEKIVSINRRHLPQVPNQSLVSQYHRVSLYFRQFVSCLSKPMIVNQKCVIVVLNNHRSSATRLIIRSLDIWERKYIIFPQSSTA